MLLRGLIRPKARWPFGLFQAPPAHVMHEAQGRWAGLGGPVEQSAIAAGDSVEAHAYYCGQFTFAGESVPASPEALFQLTHPSAEWRAERDRLAWLRHFCASPRRLHIYYLARLIDGWIASSYCSRNMKLEMERMNNLAAALPNLAFHAGEREQGIFRHALSLQCARVMQIKARDAGEAAAQSLCLLGLSCREEHFRQLQGGAWLQLSASLPQIVMADGSDVWRNPERAMELAGALNEVLGPNGAGHVPADVMAACDRLRAYLAMFRLGQGLWSAEIVAEIPSRLTAWLEGAQPIGHASQGGRTFMQQGETRILAHWGRDFQQTFAEIAQGGRLLFLLHNGQDAQRAAPQSARHEAGSTQGELLKMSWLAEELRHERSIYVSADGKDMRFEERWAGEAGPHLACIDLPSKCKILCAQDRAGANIYMPDGSGWHLRVRGTKISCAESGKCVKIDKPDGGEARVQWALKKHPSSRSRGGRSQRKEEPESELPF